MKRARVIARKTRNVLFRFLLIERITAVFPGALLVNCLYDNAISNYRLQWRRACICSSFCKHTNCMRPVAYLWKCKMNSYLTFVNWYDLSCAFELNSFFILFYWNATIRISRHSVANVLKSFEYVLTCSLFFLESTSTTTTIQIISENN